MDPSQPEPVVSTDPALAPTTPDTSSQPADHTNLDELTMRQQEAIDEEISSTTPLVGPLEPLSVLRREYTEDPIYLEKISTLSSTYPRLRRTRPDGNCFYRAFSFGVLESLLGRPSQIAAFHARVTASKQLLSSAGFNQFTVDDFYETFLELVERVRAGMGLEELEREFQEPSLADYLVVYLRIVTSAELRLNSEFYQNFVEERTVEEFCQLEVEPMYKESDHLHVIGLARAMGVGVRVVYVDRGAGAQHSFPEEDSEPAVVMLYRPGHYDIIYAEVGGGKEVEEPDKKQDKKEQFGQEREQVDGGE